MPTADESLQQRSWSSAGEHTVPSRACEEVKGWFDELSQAVSMAVAEQVALLSSRSQPREGLLSCASSSVQGWGESGQRASVFLSLHHHPS